MFINTICSAGTKQQRPFRISVPFEEQTLVVRGGKEE
jgi:hypothetical protein